MLDRFFAHAFAPGTFGQADQRGHNLGIAGSVTA